MQSRYKHPKKKHHVKDEYRSEYLPPDESEYPNSAVMPDLGVLGRHLDKETKETLRSDKQMLDLVNQAVDEVYKPYNTPITDQQTIWLVGGFALLMVVVGITIKSG